MMDNTRRPDTRYCYAVACSWHGPISEVGKSKPMPKTTAFVGNTPLQIGGNSLPCCPYCGSMLFEVPSKEKWDEGVAQHEAKGHSGYTEFLAWTRTQKQCWPTLRTACTIYEFETGKTVKWDL